MAKLPQPRKNNYFDQINNLGEVLATGKLVKELHTLKEEILETQKNNVLLTQHILNIQKGKDAVVDEESIARKVLKKIPTPKDGLDGRDGKDGEDGKDAKVDIKAISKEVLNNIPENKPSLKIIQETIDPEVIIDKISSLPDEKKKKLGLKASLIEGLDKIVDTSVSRSKQYLSGGGDTVKAGTNVTITTDTNGNKVINASGAGSPLTTKGDLYSFSNVDTRLPVGTDGQVLSADSTQATGLKWIAPPGAFPGSLDAGQVAFGTGSNTIGGDDGLYWDNTNKRLGIGTKTPTEQLDITGNFKLGNTTNASKNGIIYKDGVPFLHDFNYGYNGTVTTAGQNTIIGLYAGNLTMGSTALYTWEGSMNTFIGHYSGNSNTKGYANVFMGRRSGYSNTTGYENIFDGYNAGYSNTSGYQNSFIGSYSGYSNTTGLRNSFMGFEAGRYLANGSTARSTGDYGVFLGANTKASANGTTNEIVIGYDAIGNGSNSITLGNTSISKTILRGNVGIDNTSPSEKLHVVGNGLFTGTVKVGAYTLPSTDGTANQVLKTDGSGAVSWQNDNSNVKRYIRVNATTDGSNYAMDGTKEVVLIDYTDPCEVTLPTVDGLPDGSVFEIQYYNWDITGITIQVYSEGRNSEEIDVGYGISSAAPRIRLDSNPQANTTTPLSLRIMWLASDNVWTVLQGGVFNY